MVEAAGVEPNSRFLAICRLLPDSDEDLATIGRNALSTQIDKFEETAEAATSDNNSLGNCAEKARLPVVVETSRFAQ